MPARPQRSRKPPLIGEGLVEQLPRDVVEVGFVFVKLDDGSPIRQGSKEGVEVGARHGGHVFCGEGLTATGRPSRQQTTRGQHALENGL